MSSNCNYCILVDVCCVMTVHNILYRFDNTQRDDLSLSQKKKTKFSSFKYHYLDLFMLEYRVILKFAVRPHAYVGRSIPHIVTETDVSLSVHNSPPIVPILILANPVHTLPPHFFTTRQQSAILTRGLIPSYFPTITLCEIPLFTTCATYPANIIFHNTYMAKHTKNKALFFFGATVQSRRRQPHC